jgi:hypothetical protein
MDASLRRDLPFQNSEYSAIRIFGQNNVFPGFDQARNCRERCHAAHNGKVAMAFF